MKKTVLHNLLFTVLSFVFVFSLIFYSQAWANTTEMVFEQEVGSGSIIIYFADEFDALISSPSVDFPSVVASLEPVDSTSYLGSSEQILRVENPLSTGFEVSISPELSTGNFENDAVWDSGSYSYPIYSPDVDLGSLMIDPTTATSEGCGMVSFGSQSSFMFVDDGDPETNVENIGLVSAPESSFCSLDLTGVELVQRIPGQQPAGNYELGMVLTATVMEPEEIEVDECYIQQGENTDPIYSHYPPGEGYTSDDYVFVTECDSVVDWTQMLVEPEIWRDNTTGLYWTERFADISWYSSGSHCDNLDHGGRQDWRMATRDELMQAAPQYINIGPECDHCYSGNNLYYSTSGTFAPLDTYHYWATNEVQNYPDFAWLVTLETGVVDYFYKFGEGGFGLRCVARD